MPSIQTQLIYCGDNLQKLRDLPDAFETAMQRQRRDKGFFIAFGFTRDANLEINRAMREHNLEIIPITVQEILDEEVHIRV